MPNNNDSGHNEERVIYVMCSQNDRKFYIGQSTKKAARETYRHNFKGRREATKEFINEVIPERPCLFILESFNGDKKKGTNLIIVWAKILIENGYVCYNQPSLIEMTEHLFIETQMLYEERKTLNLKEILSCSNCALPTFNHETCDKYPLETTGEQLKTEKNSKLTYLSLTHDDLKVISNYAKKFNMEIPNYIRMAALNPTIVQIDYSIVAEHTKELAEVRSAINRLVFTIDATNNYLPKEIESVVNMMNALFQSENKLIKAVRKLRGTKLIDDDEEDEEDEK